MKLYDYYGNKVYLKKTKYVNNNVLAILMYCEDGEPYGTVTVNLPYAFHTDFDCSYVDTNNFDWGGRSIVAWLVENEIGEMTGELGES